MNYFNSDVYLKHDSVMSLGDLIQSLAEASKELCLDTKVKIRGFNDDEVCIGEFCSWRGSYYELALQPNSKNDTTLGDFIKMCTSQNGATYCGYKGGEFAMNMDSEIWIDYYGNCSNHALKCLEFDDGVLYLVCEK